MHTYVDTYVHKPTSIRKLTYSFNEQSDKPQSEQYVYVHTNQHAYIHTYVRYIRTHIQSKHMYRVGSTKQYCTLRDQCIVTSLVS